ncbi:hypothetical protein SD37_16345 [Amycolatopsis orientalis]|uniref:Uncharacterized protein n=1 Tax=Amycolatopsis orientalis TaxID=31958 RepID=A0A193BXW3_AMYOR|nr:hypothetical protein [Amycolatopsis orientalis]ANN17062.1 hypothetical protein SD37_16345 [Amycolatopsis orientalis]
MEPMSAEPPYLLAAQAGTVVRRLYRRVREGGADSPADLFRTLGALRQLTDDLAHVLPGLQDQLEEQLLSGELGSAEAAGEAWDKVADVGRALVQARAGGLLMAEELRTSQRMLGELTAR